MMRSECRRFLAYDAEKKAGRKISAAVQALFNGFSNFASYAIVRCNELSSLKGRDMVIDRSRDSLLFKNLNIETAEFIAKSHPHAQQIEYWHEYQLTRKGDGTFVQLSQITLITHSVDNVSETRRYNLNERPDDHHNCAKRHFDIYRLFLKEEYKYDPFAEGCQDQFIFPSIIGIPDQKIDFQTSNPGCSKAEFSFGSQLNVNQVIKLLNCIIGTLMSDKSFYEFNSSFPTFG